MPVTGLDELAHGGIAVAAFTALYAAARYRFARRGGRRGPADIGLD